MRCKHKCWNIIHQLWTHRNIALHEIEAANNNNGASLLTMTMPVEHTLGPQNLPSFPDHIQKITLLYTHHIQQNKVPMVPCHQTWKGKFRDTAVTSWEGLPSQDN